MTEDRSRLSGLYAITDQDLIPERLFAEYVSAALKGGAGIIQYRDKSSDKEKRLQQASLCRQLCDQHDAVFIINDNIDLCRQVGADGVHLGKDDDAIDRARASLGNEAIIGISCYDDMQRAIDALEDLDVQAGIGELEGAAARVKVDDKRMITCRADLNQLVPFKYDWEWQKYVDGCATV